MASVLRSNGRLFHPGRLRFSILGVLLYLLLADAASGTSGCSLEMRFEYAAGRDSILLPVKINGRDALLIVDTGSAHTVLRPEAVGLNPKELIPTHAASGGAGFMGDAVGQEVSLQVGSWKWEKRRVAVMDLSGVLSAYREKIDGVLGLDFFKEFSQVTINFKDKTITFIGEDGAASAGVQQLTYRNLAKAETVASILAKEETYKPTPDSKEDRKEFEKLLRSAHIIRKAMDLVDLGGVEAWPKYGYDSVAVFSDPEVAFPGADERTLDWIRGALMFTPAKGKNMFPIYVNLSALRKQPLLDPTGGNDPDTVAAIFSVMFVHELRHEKGDGELETMGAIDRQIGWLVRNKKLSSPMGDAVHKWAKETHRHEAGEVARTDSAHAQTNPREASANGDSCKNLPNLIQQSRALLPTDHRLPCDRTLQPTPLRTKDGSIVLVSVGPTEKFKKGDARGTQTIVEYRFETPPPPKTKASEDTVAWLMCNGQQVGPDYKVKTSTHPDKNGVFKDTLLFAGGEDLMEKGCELHAILHIYINGDELGLGVYMILRLNEPPQISRRPDGGDSCKNLPDFIRETRALLPTDHRVPCDRITLISDDDEFASNHPGPAFQQVLRDDTAAFVIVGRENVYIRERSAVFQRTKALYGYDSGTRTQDTDLQRGLLKALWMQILYEEAEHLAGNHNERSACLKGLAIAKLAWTAKYGVGSARKFFDQEQKRCESRDKTGAYR